MTTATQATIWEDIFASPKGKELIELRKGFTSAKKWCEFLEINYPGEYDLKEQKELKLQENREIRMAKCGRVFKSELDPKAIGRKWRVTRCKLKGCPNCDRIRKEKQLERAYQMSGGYVSKIKPEDETAFKATVELDIESYTRFECNGDLYYVTEKEHPGGVKVDYNNIEKIAEAMFNATSKITGSLGKIDPKMMIDRSDEEIKAEQEWNSLSDEVKQAVLIMEEEEAAPYTEEIKVRATEIKFNESSTLNGPGKLDDEVYSRIDVKGRKKNADTLQWLMYEIEEVTKAVCEEHNIEIKFLYIVTKKIDMREVRWENLEKLREKAKKE